ncbi:16S rRNA (adenine(1518)-N(6)/adenine(1519)-N(6))-dimethyltransferase RsmA [bacterium]|nr:16S rRNA (adenine(1518)-N(6)/adenine(1519)-N(6))-dimethyltransferase RsmA [bacterium]MBU4560774.1 16S rRNA (adenine(1518)-N(6)/adenine(1519)-N(6))-dimethyltransferase RsmA [bacterium]MCG2676057.1 16S rRNA (adenine(1518)-N(6)/adenine(1519)-N(6))-dimethyltransferase RsmA [bacterium]MCG2677947.1 16S rRNA (adenine(1518)-N(6)/adenine(1519)-N(6))-dimethyltransferase RsmA [bacterium]
MALPKITKEFLREHGIRIKKRLGQNFLIDEGILNKIVEIADLSKNDIVIEIGPGIGTLTKKLAEKAKKVLAIEIDENLVKLLKEILKSYSNVEIIQADILKINLKKLVTRLPSYPVIRFKKQADWQTGRLADKVKVVANLPYYITTPIIIHLLRAREILSNIVVMVQKEVGRRMVANPRTKDYGALSLLVQYYTKPQITIKVPRNAFLPEPEVDSCVVNLEVREKPAVEVKDEELFFKVVRAAFEQRRKTLKNALSRARDLDLSKKKVLEILEKADIKSLRRGETLSLEEFARLSNLIAGE